MKTGKRFLIFDWVVIILGMCYGVSIVSQVFYVPSLGMVVPLCSFMVLSYLIRFGLQFPVANIVKTPIYCLFFIIILLDLLQALFHINSGGNFFNASGRVVYQFFFFSYVYNVYKEKGYDSFIKPYIGYALYNVCAIVLMALLILAGLSWMHNPLNESVQILAEDIEGAGGGQLYYFPYYISVVAEYHLYSLFPLLPGITGLSHEPHVIMWVITPPLIMALAYKTSGFRKSLFILFFIFILLETFSTMALLCIVPIVLFHILWKGRSSGKLISALLIITLFLSVVLVAYITFKDEISIITEVVSQKASKGDGSHDYSSSMLGYITSFDTLFGYGNLPTATGDIWQPTLEHQSIGFISGILDICLYLILFSKSFKMAWLNNKAGHFIGLGGMYLLLHGLKVNYLVFGYPLFAYFIIIICESSLAKGKNLVSIPEKSLFSK